MSTPSLKIFENLPESAVVDYLRQHPDVFTRHEELLAKMEILPSPKGPAISLVERQLTVLREENRQLQHKFESLIAIAQKNEQLNQRIQRIVAALASASSPEEFFNTLYDCIQHEFNTDALVVRLFFSPNASFAGRPEFVEYDAQVFALFETVLEQNQTLCGRLTSEQTTYLFSNDQINSAVLIPLGVPKPQGILGLGSQEVSRFHAGMSTDLLRYMGELVSHLLKWWLRD